MRRPPFALAFALGALAAYTVVRTAEAVRDLRGAHAPLPKDPARYGRTRRALTLASLGRGLATSAVTATLVAPPLQRRLSTGRTWLDPALFYAAGTLADTIVSLPVDYVEGYAFERDMALSEQALSSWLADRAKGAALGIAIGGALTTGFAAIVRAMPRRWPLVGVAALPPLLVVANLVGPVYLAPLFNRFTPLEDGPLLRRIRALAERYGVGNAAILRVDMSKQTKKANAYVTGVFGTNRIVLGDTLVDNFTEDETLFVVAHELGHYVARDAWRAIALGTAAGAFALLRAAWVLAHRFPPEERASAAALATVAHEASVAATLLGPVLAGASRRIERAADRFALDSGEAPRAGAAAFRRLRDQNMAEDEQPWWFQMLFGSHPSLRERIALMEAEADAVAVGAR
jgi:STE24 endopeptidase